MTEIIEIKSAILSRLSEQEFRPKGCQKRLLMVSDRYPGLWLEHVYDSIVYAKMYPEKLYLAENAVGIFFDLQTEYGQLPFVVRNDDQGNLRAGYSQIQECVSIGSLALAVELGLDPTELEAQAKEVKKRLFEVCFDEQDCFFYDVDKNDAKRKILSSQIFHLFIEGVLDKQADAELIAKLCERYIFNRNLFFTPYPFPAVSISDPTWKPHVKANCWGYYTQGLIDLRCTLWMEKYGFGKQFETLCRQWVNAWTTHFDTLKLGQELHPVSGEPSSYSEWYSAGMLMYLYSAQYLGI